MSPELRRCLLQDLGSKEAAIRYIRTKVCSGVTEYQDAADEFERELRIGGGIND